MKLDVAAVRKCLKSFDLNTLFREHLGWDKHQSRLDVPIGDTKFQLTALAQKRGFVVYTCDAIPDRATRLKIDHQITKSAREHFVVYADKSAGQQVWQWIRREPGKPIASRDHRYDVSQSGTALIQRLERIVVDLDEEETFTLVQATSKVRKAFDVEKVTKKFYERFKEEHGAFLKFIQGIKAKTDLEWYTSLMLNRLMFVYFIQKKGFLDNDTDYLRNRLKQVHELKGKDKFHSFYRYFLLRLFHDGLGKHENDRKLNRDLEKLLGKVPYLNGGFFEVHQLEARNTEIDIPDKAFERLFDFFDEFRWHLDERPLRQDNEINPDVVGYIFEKYINQKQMGAYYTKEDITEYISKNTIIPFLFEAAEKKCPIAFKPGSFLWRLLSEDPDRYIYAAVRHGVIDDDGSVIPLPKEIEAGVKKIEKRDGWNKPAAEPFALPTETWREHVARRQRCLELREKLRSGVVHQVNDLITLNLDIWQFARDSIVNCEGPELLRAFWQAIEKVTVLDPTCGSGAFLFAALRILESLYSDCLERMERFVEDLAVSDESSKSSEGAKFKKFQDFKSVLSQVSKHANERYFTLKSIIINNLFGVDIMEEAVEICKLRLFLKLAAQVEEFDQIEPLPDIDFNIRAGNTLVGYVSLDQIRNARESEGNGKSKQKLIVDSDSEEEIRRIEEDALAVEKAFEQFRQQQTDRGGRVTAKDKQELRKRLNKLDAELDRYLATEYGIDTNARKPEAFDKWKVNHQPFHWFVEFYGIMANGGFDVIVGNPPYVATNNVNYLSIDALSLKLPDIYAHILLQSLRISSSNSRLGLIVPLSITFGQEFTSLRTTIAESGNSWFSSFDNIPAALFAGVSQRCTIWIGDRSLPKTYTSQMYRWRSVSRTGLIPNISYTELNESLVALVSMPKVGSSDLLSVIDRCEKPKGVNRQILTHNRNPEYRLGFSPSARNFISAFIDPPPCLDDASLEPLKSSDHGSIGISSSSNTNAAIIAIAGECFFHHWLVWGDGFHVTSGNVSSFLKLLEAIPDKHLEAIKLLGQCLWARRNEALVFKRNSAKYVGNFNFRDHRYLTRRADLLLMAGLEIKPNAALEVFAFVQRVLSINEFAGEKSIPPIIKKMFSPNPPDKTIEIEALSISDNLITDYFGCSTAELDFLTNDGASHEELVE